MHLQQLLEPLTTRPGHAGSGTGCIIMLVFSALCIFLAPLVMPEGYNWVSQAISESAAQGLRSAWVARLGFILFGLGVLWLALYRRDLWARGVYWPQLTFAVCMLGTAAFSHKPWLADAALDTVEDFLHSLTATAMGFAFTLGVIVRLLQRKVDEQRQKSYDLIAIVAATALPMTGVFVPSIAGLLQRTLFVIAYLWFMHEALYPGPSRKDR